MNNISETIVFVNIQNTNGQREIREARFTQIFSKFEDIAWCDYKCKTNPKIYGLRNPKFMIEIAGLGVMNNFDLNKLKGVICLNENDACIQKNYIYTYAYGSYNLDLRWTEIEFDTLNIKSGKFTTFDDGNSAFKKLKAMSWYYDGTMARSVVLCNKFQYDFINDMWVEFDNLDADFNDYKLYASKEMCEADNKPKIVRFDRNPQHVKKVVTFTMKAVVEVEEGIDDETISNIAYKQLKRDKNGNLLINYIDVQ